MTKEPYFISNLTSIKPSNNRNYSIVSPDLPSITNTQLKYAPPLNITNDNEPTATNVDIKARKRSIEPYYNKPMKIGVLPPAILNQFTYHFHDECAIIDDDDDDDYEYEYYDDIDEELINYSGSVIAPGNMLDNVYDNYDHNHNQDDQCELESTNDFKKSMTKIKVPPLSVVNDDDSNLSIPNILKLEQYFKYNNEILKTKLLIKSNNPNILINERSRKLSDSLLAPNLQQQQQQDLFVNDQYDYCQDNYYYYNGIKGNVRDDYSNNNESYSFLI